MLESFFHDTLAFRYLEAVLWICVMSLAIWISLTDSTFSRRYWLFVGAIALVYVIEIVFQFRFMLTQLFRDLVLELGGEGAIRSRRVMQVGIIIGLVLPLACYIGVRVRRSPALSTPLKLTLVGIAIVATGLVLETVSFHYLDQLPHAYAAIRCIGLVVTAVGLAFGLRVRRVALRA